MLCSARELKLSDDHGGLLVLDDDAPVGADMRAAPAPRRHDLHAQAHAQPRPLPQRLRRRARGRGAHRRAAQGADASRRSPRRSDARCCRCAVEAPDLCGRFSGPRRRAASTPRAKTPAWMVERLARCGQRTVAPLVDISNYVMFEFGRPSHIFDLDKIDGGLDGALGAAGRVAGAAQRQHRRARRRRSASSPTTSRVESLAGIMGGAAHRGVRRHAQRLRRGRVLVARGGRRALAPLQLLDRCRAPLRARRRSGDDGRAHRAHHRADPRDLRRRETRCGPIDDHVVTLPDARRR